MEKRNTILIVDDDQRNIFALAAVLKARGYALESADGMQGAFEVLARNRQIDVLLLDMMMPDMDGYEALPRLKQHPDYGSIPVIAVTAQAMVGDREKCLEAGADDYLSKPVDIDVLLKILQRFL